jgi:proton-coupled amino acid transporter
MMNGHDKLSPDEEEEIDLNGNISNRDDDEDVLFDGLEMKSLMAGGQSQTGSNDGDNDDGLEEDGLDGVNGDESTPIAKSVNAQHGDFGEEGTATNKQVAVNIFICFVGAGMLGMPYAFAQSGWLLGSLTLAGVSTANVYAMLLLVKCRKKLEAAGNSNIHGYGDLGREAFGPLGESFVNVMLVISQLGFATAYIIFIAANLYSISDKFEQMYVCYGCIPVLSLLVQIRDMKTLSPFSLIADVAMLFGLSSVFFEDWEYYEPHNSVIHLAQWDSFLYVTGVSLYSLEGVAMVLPLESSCADRKQFPKLLCAVVAGITMLMATFGTAGYIGFGDATQAPITLNLLGTWATFVKCALCLALYLTYPIMMFPVSNVMEDMFLRQEQKPSRVFRASVVVLTATVAYAIPDFGKFLSLVGSSICVILGFILPCAIHLTLSDWKGGGLKWWEIVIDILLMSFGVVFGALGTFRSCMELLDSDSSGATDLG